MNLAGWSAFVILTFGEYSPACNYIDQMILRFGAKHIPEVSNGDLLNLLINITREAEKTAYLKEAAEAETLELYPGEFKTRVDKWQ